MSAIIQSNGGQTSQSIGYFTTSIPPRTISYTNTVSNTNTDPILSAQLTYAYQLSCSPTSDCPVSSGTISISKGIIMMMQNLFIFYRFVVDTDTNSTCNKCYNVLIQF